MKPLQLTLTAALALSIPMWASAGAGTREDAALACARVAQTQTGEAAYELVKLRAQPGGTRFSVWLNTRDQPSAAFCKTSHGRVTQLYLADERWDQRPSYPLPHTRIAAN